MPDQKYKPGSAISLQAVLDREPEVIAGKQRLGIDGLVVYAPVVPEIHFGDKVEVTGTIECSRQGQDCARLIVSRPEVRVVGNFAPNIWLTVAFTIRTRFVETYQSILNRDEANLLSGVVLGSVGLDREFKGKLANVGLTHVVAASGMNVSLFSGFVLWILSVFKWHRTYKVIVAAIMIVFYSTITGFEPPIVRAAIMAIAAMTALMLGRQGTGLVGLLISACVMLWVSPALLVSASFLLSFSSMAGQIFLGSSKVGLTKFVGPVMEIFLQSLTAIVFTFPIVLWFFARFSLVSLFTNVLTLWTIEPLMILGGIAGILGTVSVGLARIVALPAGVLLSFFLWVVEVFGRDERLLLKIPGIDWTFFLGYYLLLGGIILWWRQRRGD